MSQRWGYFSDRSPLQRHARVRIDARELTGILSIQSQNLVRIPPPITHPLPEKKILPRKRKAAVVGFADLSQNGFPALARNAFICIDVENPGSCGIQGREI